MRGCRAAEIFDDPASVELFAEYDHECANPLIGSTAPVRGLYEALEGIGFGQCFGAYEDGKLRGVAFVLAAMVPHYGRHFATVESLFVASEARTSGLGTDLMIVVKEYARACGCTAIFYTAPIGSRLAKLLALKEECCNTNLIFTEKL